MKGYIVMSQIFYFKFLTCYKVSASQSEAETFIFF